MGPGCSFRVGNLSSANVSPAQGPVDPPISKVLYNHYHHNHTDYHSQNVTVLIFANLDQFCKTKLLGGLLSLSNIKSRSTPRPGPDPLPVGGAGAGEQTLLSSGINAE